MCWKDFTSTLKNIFTWYITPECHFFTSTLNMWNNCCFLFFFFVCLFFCFHFRWEVLCHFIFAPLYIVCLFSLNEFHYFSLSLVLSNLIRLGVVFFMFLLLAICGASWSVSFQQIWNAFYYLFEHIFCLPPPSGTPFTHILNWSMHIDALFISFSLFSLHFFLESLYCHVFRFSNVFFCSI